MRASRRGAAPSSGQIRRRFGSWRAATQVAFGQPESDPLRRRLGTARSAFTGPEVVAALRRFAEKNRNTPSTQGEYLRWARDTRSREGTRTARLPTSNSTFIRLFGSFTRAVTVATLHVAKPMPGRGDSRAEYFATRSGEALREFLAEQGAPVTQPRYEQWRARRAAAEMLPIPPTSQTVVRAFGTWRTAVSVAVGAESAGHARGRGREYTDEELLAGLRACARDTDARPTIASYQSYRARRAQAGEQLARIETIRVRIGLWAAAVDRALDGSGQDEPQP